MTLAFVTCTIWLYFVLTEFSIQANKEKRAVIFKRAESYVKEYRDAERESIRLARAARQEGNFFVADEPKLVFVVRIKGYVVSFSCRIINLC